MKYNTVRYKILLPLILMAATLFGQQDPTMKLYIGEGSNQSFIYAVVTHAETQDTILPINIDVVELAKNYSAAEVSISSLQSEVSSLKSELAQLKAQLAALQKNPITPGTYTTPADVEQIIMGIQFKAVPN